MKKQCWLIMVLFSVFISSSIAEDKAQTMKMYTVEGLRHGHSFFPYVDYVQTRAKVPGEMDFAHYHKYEEVIYFLKKWEKDFPNLVELYSVGRSFEGREIWQMTIGNRSTGKDTDKPAMFLEGNRHSGEVTGA